MIILYDLIINMSVWDRLNYIEKSQIKTTCGDNVRSSIALSQVRQIKHLKNLVKNNIVIKIWSPEILRIIKSKWN